VWGARLGVKINKEKQVVHPCKSKTNAVLLAKKARSKLPTKLNK
jgi:hypothetical protein